MILNFCKRLHDREDGKSDKDYASEKNRPRDNFDWKALQQNQINNS